ncbi:hypothetical protein WJX74_004751 [Apatococcus lobatus]|uniref:protein-serine/threonine phosphatase n=1 Tax=Apatococcus lobatus TaxID=904363 RepID=A0AAW1RHN8_9CHLO
MRETHENGQGALLDVQYAISSQPGCEPGLIPKGNQDSWAACEYMGDTATLFLGVFDGHGQEGAKASNAVALALPKLIKGSPSFQAAQYRPSFAQNFPQCNQQLCANTSIETSLSGTTGVTALLHGGNKLLVANLGDSRCMLGRVNAEGTVTAIPLSSDHSCDVPSEAARIRERKGRVASYMFDGVPVGPLRIWLADVNIPGLSMTRSFGDKVAATVGIIADPEIVERELHPQDRYLILCSDGIHEFLENEQIISMVHTRAESGAQPHEICAHMVEEARRHWIEEEGDVIDDCTMILAVLNATSPKAAPAVISVSASSASEQQSTTNNLLKSLKAAAGIGSPKKADKAADKAAAKAAKAAPAAAAAPTAAPAKAAAKPAAAPAKAPAKK